MNSKTPSAAKASGPVAARGPTAPSNAPGPSPTPTTKGEYAMSSVMQALNKKGTKTARDMVSSKFVNPVDLDDLGLHINQIQKELSLAESQLNVSVQGKLDALKRAADIMYESTAKLTLLSSTLSKIDERIAGTNTVISKFEYLKRVDYVRENIQVVISQVEFFARVPERVKYLRNILSKDPTQLKEVFLEALKLESLRTSLIKEIKVSTRKSSVTAANFNNKGDYSQEAYQTTKSSVEHHLRVVPELMKEVRQSILSNIERFFELGAESPADLVMTFEIVEMYQEYINRRSEQARRQAIKMNQDGEVAANEIFENFSADVQARIRRRIVEKVDSIFVIAKETVNEKEDKFEVNAILGAANQLLSIMTEFKNEISVCMPPHYEPMDTFMQSFEDKIIPEISTLVNKNISKLDVSDIMRIIDWIEYFKAQMECYECGDNNCVKEFVKISEELMNEYLFRIKTQVVTWFDNIKKRPLEIIKTSNNNLITSHPEDMFNVIHLQLSVAKEKLPPEHIKDVINSCLQVLREVQRESYDNLSNNWKELDVETLCTIINDNQRMQDKCEEFSEYIISSVVQDDHREMLTAMLDEVSSEYLSIAVSAINFLSRCALADLDDPVFSKLFTAEWESGEQLTSIMVATLDDYFADISNWISEYYYKKFVKETFQSVTGTYIMSIRKHANGAFHFMSEIAATARVLKDKEVVEEFFSKYEDILIGIVIPQEMQCFSDLATVISATHVSGVEKEIKSLFDKFKGDGYKLVSAVFLSNPTLSKSERQQNIDRITKLFDTEVNHGTVKATYSEQFKTFDVVDNTNANKNTQIKQTKARFWGRKK